MLVVLAGAATEGVAEAFAPGTGEGAEPLAQRKAAKRPDATTTAVGRRLC